ncbi:cytochrome P450 [Hypomontagnella monticulosa]|nr:cytochrome P450 [Hypomontagnella monticulosa]
MAILNFFVAYMGAALLFYYVLILSFRLVLHPLRMYPGPLAARLSEGYGAYYALKQCLHIKAYRNHMKYGPVVRQAPDRLIFNSVAALKDIYQNEKITKSYVYSAAQPDQHNIFTTSNKQEHRPKRKLISRLLSEQSTRAFEPVLINQVTVFLNQLLQSKEKPLNMTPTCRHLGLDIAGHLGFGYGLNLQTDSTHRYLTQAITFGNYRVNTCMQSASLAMIKPGIIMDFFPNSLRSKLMKMIGAMITARLSQPPGAKHDLLSVFNDESDVDIKTMKQGNLWTEAVFFFPAGGETTASALSAAFFYLSQDPTCYEKLAVEIRGAFNTASEIRGGSRLSSCRYLRACIDETLRMSPPVPATLWRESVSEDKTQPLVIDGHVIPPGTQIGVNIYSLHHNEEYFPNSFQFRPERWMEGTKDANAEAFTPFSIGARGCAGKALAYLELSLVIALTFWYFDFETEQEDSSEDPVPTNMEGRIGGGEFPIYDLFAAKHDGPKLVFHPRGSLCEELVR